MMPGSNGFVICKELRKISPVPVIMLTARDSDLDYATGLDLGSDDYLTKPFSPMALVMRVKALFRRMEFDRQIYTERDLMTNVYNKVSGMNIAENKLRISGEESLHALFIIDIDNFKCINDKLGHAAGDEVIIEAAKTISKVFRDSDIVSRFGGDEFVVFAAHITDMGFVEEKAEELCKALRQSYGEGEKIQNISASVGVACFPIHGLTYNELFKHADETLYKVKEKGKDGFAIYAGIEGGKS
jgi:diguanylate cyclase (GGDEF)-like protein